MEAFCYTHLYNKVLHNSTFISVILYIWRMGILLIFIGFCLIGYGAFKFLQVLWLLLKALYFNTVASEKAMDKELHKQWSQEQDYKDFEKQIPKSL